MLHDIKLTETDTICLYPLHTKVFKVQNRTYTNTQIATKTPFLIIKVYMYLVKVDILVRYQGNDYEIKRGNNRPCKCLVYCCKGAFFGLCD